MKKRKYFTPMILVAAASALSACGGVSSASSSVPSAAGISAPDPSTAAAQLPPRAKWSTDALIYIGQGAALNDAQSMADNIKAHGLTYKFADEAEFNQMSLDDLASYGIIVWPGGYAGQMTSALTPETRQRIREAVTVRGVSYHGVCAGAFFAVSPAAAAGKAGPDYGLSLIDAPVMDYYVPPGQTSDGVAEVLVDFPDASKRSILWYGGPDLPKAPHSVLGHYPNGSSAMVQMVAGNGFITLSSPHPEAPDAWVSGNGLSDPDGRDDALSWSLISAALYRKPLPSFN
ncbi:MAG: hypothetical protein ACXVBW_00590 [Bdellovibrionota bacterium]